MYVINNVIIDLIIWASLVTTNEVLQFTIINHWGLSQMTILCLVFFDVVMALIGLLCVLNDFNEKIACCDCGYPCCFFTILTTMNFTSVLVSGVLVYVKQGSNMSLYIPYAMINGLLLFMTFRSTMDVFELTTKHNFRNTYEVFTNKSVKNPFLEISKLMVTKFDDIARMITDVQLGRVTYSEERVLLNHEGRMEQSVVRREIPRSISFKYYGDIVWCFLKQNGILLIIVLSSVGFVGGLFVRFTIDDQCLISFMIYNVETKCLFLLLIFYTLVKTFILASFPNHSMSCCKIQTSSLALYLILVQIALAGLFVINVGLSYRKIC